MGETYLNETIYKDMCPEFCADMMCNATGKQHEGKHYDAKCI